MDPPSVHRESDLAIFFVHFDYPDVAKRLFHVIETARIRHAVLARYPGARRYDDALVAAIRADAMMPEPTPAGVIEALELELLGIHDYPSSLLHLVDRSDHADVQSSAASTVDCYLAMALPPPMGDGELIDSDDGPALEWLQREARLEDWEEELADLDAQMVAMEIAQQLPDEDVVVAEAEGDIEGQIREVDLDIAVERDQLKRRIDMEKSALRHALGEERDDARSYLYDEWDYHNQTYIRGWCRLYEERLLPDDDCDTAALVESIRPYARSVRRQFEQIRPGGYQRQNHVPDGDELDLNAIVAARADIRVGTSPDERVYSRRERVRRDVGAAFLVDLSASTDDPIPDPDDELADDAAPVTSDIRDPYFDEDEEYDWEAHMAAEAARRRIIHIQREAVLVMASALEGLGDQYGIYGFSGYGRDCVEYFVAKEFNDRFDQRTLEAIAAMKPKRSTRMGPAIRHAVKKLEASGTALKVLMIISDGFPQDCDYGPDRGQHEYGLQDTAKALEEAERRGVQTFCVTVDRSGHDYLRRMCADERYMVIEEIEELPDALQKAYRQLTQF